MKILRSSFITIKPKLLNCRERKNFSFKNFKDLSETLLHCRNSYDNFESVFIKIALDKHAQKKKNWLRGNNKNYKKQ